MFRSDTDTSNLPSLPPTISSFYPFATVFPHLVPLMPADRNRCHDQPGMYREPFRPLTLLKESQQARFMGAWSVEPTLVCIFSAYNTCAYCSESSPSSHVECKRVHVAVHPVSLMSTPPLCAITTLAPASCAKQLVVFRGPHLQCIEAHIGECSCTNSIVLIASMVQKRI
jgi:hypothetical protein